MPKEVRTILHITRGPLWLIALMVIVYSLTSVWVGMKFGGGTRGGLIVFLTGLVVFFIAKRVLDSHMASRYARAIVGAFLVAAVAAFILIYVVYTPRAIAGGGGSDRDEAIQIAVNRLLAGLYPYGVKTYLGDSITALPGGLLLHVPTQVILGSTVYTEPIILILSLVFITQISPRAGAALAVALGGMLVFWQDFVTGGDYVTSSLLCFALAAKGVQAAAGKSWKGYFYWVFLGIAVASRPTMLMYTGTAIALVAGTVSIAAAMKWAAVTIAPSVAVVFPFWVVNPNGFDPLHVTSKGGSLPLIVIALAIGAAWFAFGLAVAMRRRATSRPEVMLALIVAPLGFVVTLPSSLAAGSWTQLGFAAMTAFLAPLAIDSSVTTREDRAPLTVGTPSPST